MPHDVGLETTVTAVTVIGAGPAGALSAALLAKRGVDVLLVDKNAFPRHKVCGCCLSPTAIAMIKQAGCDHLLEELNSVPLNKMRLYYQSSRLTLPLVQCRSLSRGALDAALVNEAKKAGAKFRAATTASIESVEGFAVKVSLNDGEEQVSSKIVIAADGLSGSSLRKLHSMQPYVARNSKVGTGAISSANNSAYDTGTIYMAVGNGGYVGLERLEDSSLDIAAALDPAYLRRMHNPADAIIRILQSCKLEVPGDIHDLEWKGTVPLTRHRPSVASRRVFAVGDSAGYVEPFTGEGIAWALSGALNVVPLAERGAFIWHNSLARHWSDIYANEVRARQGKTAIVAGILDNKFLRSAGAKVLTRVPALSPPLVKAVTCTT